MSGDLNPMTRTPEMVVNLMSTEFSAFATMNEIKHILAKQTFLFDCDGTLYNGKEVIPGALELLTGLRAAGKEIFFFTNNSSRDREQAFQKLHRMGLAMDVNEVIMSTDTVVFYLKQQNIKDIFLLGTASMRGMLGAEGITDWGVSDIVGDALSGVKEFDKAPKSLISDVKSRISHVVVGFDREFNFPKVSMAMQLVQMGVPYIQAHPDMFCPTDKGPEPDCGILAMCIEAITQRNPEIVLGKPHSLMISEVEKRTRTSRDKMVIFGDRLHVDVEMGRVSDIESVFVLTGDSQLNDINERNAPGYTLKSVADLLIALP